MYSKQQWNDPTLNALAILEQEIVTRWVSNNGKNTDVRLTMSGAWNIWTDSLRDPASCLV
jgi:hypothetical protein